MDYLEDNNRSAGEKITGNSMKISLITSKRTGEPKRPGKNGIRDFVKISGIKESQDHNRRLIRS